MGTSKKQLEGLLISSLYGLTLWGIASARTPIAWTGTLAAGLTAECVRSSRKIDRIEAVQDAFGCISGLSGDVESGLRPYTNSVQQAQTTIISHALKQLPMGEAFQQRFLDRQGVNTDWFEGFEKRSAIVVGESRDGKTHLLKWRLQRFIEANPDGHEYYIGDIDYGRAHEGDEPNTWFNSPVGQAVFTTADDIATKVNAIAQDIRDGNDAAVPTLIILDELVDTMADMDKAQLEQFMQDVRTIKNRGIKAGNITFIMGLHSTAVGETGIPQWLLRGVETIWLYRAGQEESNFNHLKGKDIEECPKQLARLPKVFNNLRPCIIYSDKKLSVKALPQLNFSNIEVSFLSDKLSPIQEWERDHWTPEKQRTVIEVMRRRVAEGKQPFANRDILPLVGIPKKEWNKTNELYGYARSAISGVWESSKKWSNGSQLEP